MTNIDALSFILSTWDVVIDATDVSHAFSEAMDDRDIWPDGLTFVSIVRGAKRPYTT